MKNCRFCGAPAVFEVTLTKGCVCFHDDRLQYLCAQHWSKLEPLERASAVDLVQPSLLPSDGATIPLGAVVPAVSGQQSVALYLVGASPRAGHPNKTPRVEGCAETIT